MFVRLTNVLYRQFSEYTNSVPITMCTCKLYMCILQYIMIIMPMIIAVHNN